MDPDSETTRDTTAAGTSRDVPPTTERAEGEGSVTMASRPVSAGGLDPADRSAPLPSPAERGRTTIHPRVLTVVARSAALSVPGSIRHTSGLGRIAGRAYPHAEVRSQHTAVDAQIQVALAWPSPVTARAAEVRDAVGRRLAEATGIPVLRVDVDVAALVPRDVAGDPAGIAEPELRSPVLPEAHVDHPEAPRRTAPRHPSAPATDAVHHPRRPAAPRPTTPRPPAPPAVAHPEPGHRVRLSHPGAPPVHAPVRPNGGTGHAIASPSAVPPPRARSPRPASTRIDRPAAPRPHSPVHPRAAGTPAPRHPHRPEVSS